MRLFAPAMTLALLIAPLPGGIAHAQDSARGAFMTLGAPGDAPRGYVAMCRDLPELCRRADQSDDVCLQSPSHMAYNGTAMPILLATPVKLPSLPENCDAAKARATSYARPALDLKQLKKVNNLVNHHVRQVYDSVATGQDELWRPSGVGRGAVGDCEDLALEKMLQLRALGYPQSATALAVAYVRGVGLHVVLVVRTSEGDMILDSMTDAIKPWQKLSYNWLRVQSPNDPNRWHRVI
ncbi:MAG: transglutaminase-like cysteine peptidase [Sphingobium sp.]